MLSPFTSWCCHYSPPGVVIHHGPPGVVICHRLAGVITTHRHTAVVTHHEQWCTSWGSHYQLSSWCYLPWTFWYYHLLWTSWCCHSPSTFNKFWCCHSPLPLTVDHLVLSLNIAKIKRSIIWTVWYCHSPWTSWCCGRRGSSQYSAPSCGRCHHRHWPSRSRHPQWCPSVDCPLHPQGSWL